MRVDGGTAGVGNILQTQYSRATLEKIFTRSCLFFLELRTGLELGMDPGTETVPELAGETPAPLCADMFMGSSEGKGLVEICGFAVQTRYNAGLVRVNGGTEGGVNILQTRAAVRQP